MIPRRLRSVNLNDKLKINKRTEPSVKINSRSEHGVVLGPTASVNQLYSRGNISSFVRTNHTPPLLKLKRGRKNQTQKLQIIQKLGETMIITF